MIKQCWLFSVFLFYALPAVAEESYGPTPEEIKFLPPYCGGPGGGDWVTILGPDRVFNNHTCYGINRINRYYKSRSTKDKQFHLQTALGDFNYSVEHLKPDFKLMPEIYYYRGLTYRLMGKADAAISDFFKSKNLDPKYSKSIAEIADFYERTPANRGKALELVTEALRHNPDSKELKRRYTKLGGQLPYPEPYVQTVESNKNPNAQVESTNSASNSTKPADANPSEKTPEANLVVAPSNTTTLTEPVTKPPQPFPGSPSNPWCRFCPDIKPSSDPGTSTPQVGPKALK
jgi:hypothetical protein